MGDVPINGDERRITIEGHQPELQEKLTRSALKEAIKLLNNCDGFMLFTAVRGEEVTEVKASGSSTSEVRDHIYTGMTSMVIDNMKEKLNGE